MIKRIKTSSIKCNLFQGNLEGYIENKMKYKKYNLYPSIICNSCSERRKLVLKTLSSTFYNPTCDVCNEEGTCTEIRDYGYPDIWIKS